MISYQATKQRTWSDSSYDYTETQYFMLNRCGSIGFERVPVDGSTKMEDELMESIEPFDFDEAVPFQTAYLAGYMADKYDVSAEESIERANTRIKKSTEDHFRSTVKGYDDVSVGQSSVQLHGGSIKYVLYPVWLLNTTWNGKRVPVCMNGQNGNLSETSGGSGSGKTLDDPYNSGGRSRSLWHKLAVMAGRYFIERGAGQMKRMLKQLTGMMAAVLLAVSYFPMEAMAAGGFPGNMND